MHYVTWHSRAYKEYHLQGVRLLELDVDCPISIRSKAMMHISVEFSEKLNLPFFIKYNKTKSHNANDRDHDERVG